MRKLNLSFVANFIFISIEFSYLPIFLKLNFTQKTPTPSFQPHLMFTDITQQLADAGYPVPAASSDDAVEKTRRKWEGLVRNQWHYKKSRPRRNPAVRRRMEAMSRVLNGLQDTEVTFFFKF